MEAICAVVNACWKNTHRKREGERVSERERERKVKLNEIRNEI